MGRADEQFPYDDIVDLPHHVSKKRPQMSMIDRAAQFSPFSALTGYEAAIKETGRLTEAQIEMDEDRKIELDRVLRVLMEKRAQNPEVSITYFLPDEKKNGGAYVTVTGQVRKIDDFERTVMLLDGREISIDLITAIEGNELLEKYESCAEE